jgi:hypothetical protein
MTSQQTWRWYYELGDFVRTYFPLAGFSGFCYIFVLIYGQVCILALGNTRTESREEVDR